MSIFRAFANLLAESTHSEWGKKLVAKWGQQEADLQARLGTDRPIPPEIGNFHPPETPVIRAKFNDISRT